MIGYCITDNEVVEDASKKEIVRRYYNELNNFKMGLCDEDTYKRIKILMEKLNIDESILDVVKPALEKKVRENGKPSIAIKIGNKIITGKQSDLMTAPGGAIINAIKYLSKIPDDIKLLSPKVLEPMLKLKEDMNGGSKLTLPEVLTALSICSVTNAMTEKALTCLKKLKDCEAHATYIVTDGDKTTLKNLKINLTCESEYIQNDEY